MKLHHQLFYISYLNILKHWPYTAPRPWLSKVANTFVQIQGSLLVQSFIPSAPRVCNVKLCLHFHSVAVRAKAEMSLTLSRREGNVNGSKVTEMPSCRNDDASLKTKVFKKTSGKKAHEKYSI